MLPVEVPAEGTQYEVAGLVNVMPELLPQSPEFPVIADRFQPEAPAPVMSSQSECWLATVAAEIVTLVPFTVDLISTRFITELPFRVKVPDTVCVPPNT